ncbi:MAG: hypothetical protein LBO79_03040 [Zoogloeaceae bacterium]|jgi:hypothetical protein|nr:hypothetical protein [Zoogloeaceae bacterium]
MDMVAFLLLDSLAPGECVIVSGRRTADIPPASCQRRLAASFPGNFPRDLRLSSAGQDMGLPFIRGLRKANNVPDPVRTAFGMSREPGFQALAESMENEKRPDFRMTRQDRECQYPLRSRRFQSMNSRAHSRRGTHAE